MKKILSILLVSILLLSLCFISVNAETSGITKAEATTIVQKAFKNFEAVQYAYEDTFDRSITIKSLVPFEYENYKREFSNFNFGITNKEQVFTQSSEGVAYPELPSNLMPRWSEIDPNADDNYFGRKITSIDDVRSFFKETVTDELLPMYMSHYKEGYETFRIGETGNVYILHAPGRYLPVKFLISCGDVLKNSPDKATMQVILGIDTLEADVTGDAVDVLIPYFETVEFTKTADGWRVSGGTAFEVMLGDREPNSNPNTGDTSSVIVPALTVTALISVALPVGIMRKRRRFA